MELIRREMISPEKRENYRCGDQCREQQYDAWQPYAHKLCVGCERSDQQYGNGNAGEQQR